MLRVRAQASGAASKITTPRSAPKHSQKLPNEIMREGVGHTKIVAMSQHLTKPPADPDAIETTPQHPVDAAVVARQAGRVVAEPRSDRPILRKRRSQQARAPPPDPLPTDPVERERWLDGIVRLAEAAAMRGVHPDTLKREAAKGRLKLLRLSERLLGVRRRDVLMLD